MELRDYLRILHRNWILILALTILGGAGAFGYSLLQTPTYEANTQLYVSVRSDSSGVSELAQGTSFARQAVVSFVDVVDSSVVLDRVINDLNLDETAQQLASKIDASSPTNSVIIAIRTSDTNAERAAAIANSVGSHFADVVVNRLEKPEGDSASLVRVETIEPALVPTSPASPHTPVNIVLGIAIGLALGLAVAVLRSILDTRIHSLHDIESATDAPVLGGIALDPDAKKRPLIVHADPRNPRTESFRSLRTNLQFVDVDGSSRSFVVSSAGPGEGKSTTTANLALALAETGARVALVDGDLRLPRVADYMGLEGGVGLTDVLIGRAELVDVLQQWGTDKLFVLPSGRTPPNPSELLGSQAMQRTLAALEEAFDYVLVDAPPLLLVTDAAVVSRFTSGVLMVAASGTTKKPQLTAAVEKLNAIGSRLFGVIVTMLPAKGPDSYGYGSYSYATVGDAPKPQKGERRSRRDEAESK
ncbi:MULTISPECIES: polysaccharide biosynthesis tyrosine autokinase [unclassified Microbacterium]|uniref:polysaccharide biosynthesis tyrosine autokinase n=1 Tax=unclassified Microbacterium TaxID=2609290 RepID=UPI00177C9FDD|nr:MULTISPECIES: polysaccharide biosynthesis tyrosine autokinase [unclassified Microbacterium]MBD8207678.1 polysaccharide biosynthesis tyrosine autokinase [Microbacterium sp. CFBP 8801]MBD8478166.1 polysaccharide biosynthesis tyrosine autokinase [Microbacterium sp. CFBP 8794]MBD8508573.1 polysaccharide biosynthesis tyrosine autokinase [Microbacterium sp. CFBP 8790]